MAMEKGRVSSETGLNLRKDPGGKRIGVLGYDEEVTILDKVCFYRVRTASGQIGYVHGDYLQARPREDRLVHVESGTAEVAEDAWIPRFEPVVYSNPNFIGEALKVDRDFVPQLDKLAGYAKDCGLKIYVTSSLRSLDQRVRGAIVKPAGKSCHHIGHALDMNLAGKEGFYNSRKLSRANFNRLPDKVQSFFGMIRDDEILRWGGDFSTEDPVHIDDNLYRRDPLLYEAKLANRMERVN